MRGGRGKGRGRGRRVVDERQDHPSLHSPASAQSSVSRAPEGREPVRGWARPIWTRQSSSLAERKGADARIRRRVGPRAMPERVSRCTCQPSTPAATKTTAPHADRRPQRAAAAGADADDRVPWTEPCWTTGGAARQSRASLRAHRRPAPQPRRAKRQASSKSSNRRLLLLEKPSVCSRHSCLRSAAAGGVRRRCGCQRPGGPCASRVRVRWRGQRDSPRQVDAGVEAARDRARPRRKAGPRTRGRRRASATLQDGEGGGSRARRKAVSLRRRGRGDA